jgi:chromosome segregation ATPase
MSEIFINKCLNKIYLTSTEYKPIKTEINLILNQIINYQKNINLMLKNIRDTNKYNISAEKLILTLRQDLKYHTESNLKFKNYFTEISKLGNNFKYNLDCLNEHKKNLQYELKDFVEIINEKEKEINELKDEKNMLILTNEALLNDKITEKNILDGQLKDAIRNLAFSTDRLNNTKTKINELTGELEMINKEITDNENEYIKKYDRLLYKYNRELEKFQIFLDNDEYKLMLNDDINERKINEFKKNVDIENFERESQTIYLNTVIEGLYKKIEGVKQNRIKKEKERERYKFLGKYFASHYKEKHKNPIKCLSKKITLSTLFSVFIFHILLFHFCEIKSVFHCIFKKVTFKSFFLEYLPLYQIISVPCRIVKMTIMDCNLIT